MTDLPSFPQSLVTSEAPRSAVTGADIAAPHKLLADALNSVAGGVDEVAVQAAKQSAQQAVTTDENGDLKIASMPLLVGRSADEWQRVAYQNYTSQLQPKIATDVTKARIQFEGDPNGFKNWSDSYVNSLEANQPNSTLAAVAKTSALRATSEAGDGILLRAHGRDVESAKQSIASNQQTLENELTALYAQGDKGSDAVKSRLADWQQLQTDRTSNPIYGYSRAQGQYDSANFLSKLEAVSHLKTIKDVFADQSVDENGQPKGGAAAAFKLADRFLTDQSLNLTEEQRSAYFHKATGEVHAMVAQQHADLGEARKAMADAIYASAHNVEIDPDLEASITDSLRKSGGAADAARFSAAMIRARQQSSFNLLPLNKMGPAIRYIAGGSAAGAAPEVRAAINEASEKTGISSAFLGRVAMRESNFDPNAKAQGSSAGGLFQFTDGTWSDVLAKHGAQYGLASNTPKTDARANALMAGELTKENAASLQAAGLPPSEGNLYVAHFAGSEGARKLLTAAPNASAADVLPDAAGANRSIFYDPSGKARTVGQVVGRLTNGFGGPDIRAVAGPGQDVRLLSGMQRSADSKAKVAWTKVETDLDAGIRPADQVVNQIVDIARISGDHDLLETIGTRLDRFDATTKAGLQPLPAQEAKTTEMERAAAAGELPPGQAAWLKDLKTRQAAITSGLDANPVATTVANFGDRFQAPAPLDLSKDDAFAAGLQQRAKVVQFAAQNWQVPPLSALDKADVQQVQAALMSPDPATKVRIFSAIGQLPEQVRMATLKKLGENGPVAATEVFAGSLLTDAPDVGAGILAGMHAKSVDKRFLPTGTPNAETAYLQARDRALPIGAFNLPARTNPLGGYAIMSQAVEALYAHRSAEAGDVSGSLNRDRLKKAADDVTGGILTHNGGPLIAPFRGMTQSTFDHTLASISDQDLQGATTGKGTPITADYLRNSGKLHALSTGRYLLQVNLDDSNPKYAAGPDGGAFVLDLRNRAAAPP